MAFGRIFLSYSHQDEAAATDVCTALRHAGFSPWLAVEEIGPGANWVAQINSALETAAYLVLLITPAAMCSSWVKLEWTAFMTRLDDDATILIPMLLTETPVPIMLRALQTIDATTDLNQGIDKLITWLRREQSSPGRRPAGEIPVHLGDTLLDGVTRRELRLVAMTVLDDDKLQYLIDETHIALELPTDVHRHRRVMLLLDHVERHGQLASVCAWLEDEEHARVTAKLARLRGRLGKVDEAGN